MNPYAQLAEYADAYPFTCPHCGHESKQRARGLCKTCKKPIEIYRFGRSKPKHRLYVHESGNCKDVIDHVLHVIRMTTGEKDFVFTNLEMQLGLARVLLNKCAGEHLIAFWVIEAFMDKKVVKGNVRSVGSILWNDTGRFDQALAYARRKAQCERAEPVQQEFMFDTEPSYVGAE